MSPEQQIPPVASIGLIDLEDTSSFLTMLTTVASENIALDRRTRLERVKKNWLEFIKKGGLSGERLMVLKNEIKVFESKAQLAMDRIQVIDRNIQEMGLELRERKQLLSERKALSDEFYHVQDQSLSFILSAMSTNSFASDSAPRPSESTVEAIICALCMEIEFLKF